MDYKEGENTMTNSGGNLDPYTAGTLALLTDTARAGRGGFGYGGYGEGGGYYGGPFATPSANAVRINRNAEFTKLGLDRVSDQNEENRRLLQEQNTSNQMTNGFMRIGDRLVDQEFRNGDRLRDLEREINQNARTAADCCCETQKEILRLDASNNLKFAELGKDICNVEARLTSEIKAIESRTIQRDLDRAERRINQLEIYRECGCGCAGGVNPCPPRG